MHEEKLKVTRIGVAKFLKKYEATGSIGRRTGLGRLTKVTAEVKAIVDQKTKEDDPTTATQLHALLRSRGYDIFLPTVLRCHYPWMDLQR